MLGSNMKPVMPAHGSFGIPAMLLLLCLPTAPSPPRPMPKLLQLQILPLLKPHESVYSNVPFMQSRQALGGSETY